MKRSTKMILLAVAAILLSPVVYGYILYLQDKTDGADPRFERELYAAVESGEPFDMAELATFAWERMYVFGPYSTQDEMEKAVGLTWTTRTFPGYWLERRTVLGDLFFVDESHNKLVFVHKDEVVLAITLRRSKADFTPAVGMTEREHARFRADGHVVRKADNDEG